MTVDTVTARQELEEIAAEYQKHDAAEKTAKAAKDKLKKPYLELFEEVIEDEVPLASVQVKISPEDLDLTLSTDEERFEKWRLTHYPEYEFTFGPEYAEPPYAYEATLRENPRLRKFEFIGPDGYKYGRTYAMVGAGVDGEGLWSYTDSEGSPFLDAVQPKVVTLYEVDEDKLREILSERPELMRVAQQYINPGTIQVRLAPIRKAKDEEGT